MRLYLRIIAFGRPYFSKGILAFLFLFLYNLFSVFSITMVIPFLQILFAEGDMTGLADADLMAGGSTESIKEWFYQSLQGWMAEYGKSTVLLWFCVVLCSSILLKNIFRYLSSFFVAPLEQGVINNMRRKLFDHLSKLSLAFFTGRKRGEIINVLVTDVQIVQESVIGTLQYVVSDPIAMLIILGTMLFISWKLTLFTLVILPLAGLFINFIAKSLKRRARKGQERLGGLIAVLDEFIGGIRIVKAFGTEDYERKKYKTLNDQYMRLMVGLKRRSDLASPLTEVLSIFVIATIILYGGNMILSNEGELEASEFIGFIALFGTFLAPIKTFSSALSRIQKGIASFQRIEEFMEIPETVREREGAQPVKRLKESFRYEDVWFRYTDEDVLKGISLHVSKGEMVALVGPSGGGKSTLADLLPRFYDPYQGRILIDGVDIRDFKVHDLRGIIGMVTQEGILFNDTVLNNIAYGADQPDRAQVEQAARVANAHDFIAALPEGYDTLIGERGTRLSGGQRQRLAIARAIYKGAEILILDEATSALDSESERLVQEALDKVMAQHTSIVIAHRLSTIIKADRIYVIDQGVIVESGTHEALLSKGGLYKTLYDLQFSK